jgi:DNA-binding transcriptional LysR family regulator
LPTILAAFHQQYPQIHHKVSVLHTNEVMALVEQGEVDLGLIFNPAIRSEVVIVKELFRQPLHLLVSSQHALTQTAPPLTLERIVAEPIFLLGETARLRIVLERIFAQRGLSVQAAIEIDSIEGLKAIVRQGNGITLMPPALLRSPQIDEGLALLPLADLTEEFIFALVYRRFGTISQSARQLINAIAEAHRSEGGFAASTE